MQDATCTPADMAYPQDIALLNSAREKLESMIDSLHMPSDGKKPRTYRRTARKEFLKVSKKRRKGFTVIRKAIKKQLGYVNRNIGYIQNYLDAGRVLEASEMAMFETIKTAHAQQKGMLGQKKRKSVPDRIVSLAQPHVRAIVRGKARAATEFGAKLEISLVDGFTRIEKISWDAFNESTTLIPALKRYKSRLGVYPKRILVDKIYRNKDNLRSVRHMGSGSPAPGLDGRPKTKWWTKKRSMGTCATEMRWKVNSARGNAAMGGTR